MAKSTDAKTNGHKVPALKTPAAKAAVKAAPKAAVNAAPKAAPTAAAKRAVKAVPKAVPKPAVKPPVKPAAKAAKTVKATPAPAAPAAPEMVREKVRKTKLVRDSFTMPEQEYAVLGQVKKACLKAGFEVRKSELLRIGVALISQLDMATLQQVLASLPQLKTGRPKND